MSVIVSGVSSPATLNSFDISLQGGVGGEFAVTNRINVLVNARYIS